MKQVLWISRHELLPAQIADLERVMGGPVRLKLWKDTVRDISVLMPMLREADAVAAVLPLELLAKLVELAGETPILQAVCRRVLTDQTVTTADGHQEPEVYYVHEYWQQILRVEVRTKRL